MFTYKKYETGNEILIAVADKSILGKTFEENDLCITVSEFYEGRECEESEIEPILEEATIINAIGTKIIDFMLKKELIKKENILYIQNIPHAQVVSVG